MAFVDWLTLNGIKHTAIPNNTFTKSWNQKLKNKRMGLHRGLADLFVIINPSQSKDGEGYALFIEMKRLRGGVQSPEQKEWEESINGLNLPNAQYYLCKGAEQAINTVSHYLKSVENSPF